MKKSIQLICVNLIILNVLLNTRLASCDQSEEVNSSEKANDIAIARDDLTDEVKNKIISISHLNDSHENLSVKWLGKGSSVIIVLAKNNFKTAKNGVVKSTNMYISYDYGSTFKLEERLKLPNDTLPVLNTFITSKINNSHFVFTDIVNNYLFISENFGQNYTIVKLLFSPRILQIHNTIPGYILASDDNAEQATDLFLSTNFGKTWEFIHPNVTKWSWASTFEQQDPFRQDRIYAMSLTANGRKGFYLTDKYFESSVFLKNNVKDFKICNKYVVITRYTSNVGTTIKEPLGLKMDVSFNKSEFNMALFNNQYLMNNVTDYYVVDCSENELIVAAKYSNSNVNLFVSNAKGNRFRLVLENVVLNNNNNKTTVDVHKVAGLNGIYIANAFENKSSTIISLITHDSGFNWSKINLTQVQSDEITKSCIETSSCSLHFLQNSLAYSYKYPGITSKESAIGIILASGIIDENIKNDTKINFRPKAVPQTFLSRDAGQTWRKITDGKYLFNIGDNGKSYK